MKIAKRVITFILTVVILTSCCFTNIVVAADLEGARPSRILPVTFSGPSTKLYFCPDDPDEGSFCFTKITNFGEDDFTTDLESATQAYNPYYGNSAGVSVDVYVYAQAELEFSDGSLDYAYHETTEENGRFARARAFGRNVMPDMAYITDFSSMHFAKITLNYPDESDPSGYSEYEYCVGDIMYVINYDETN